MLEAQVTPRQISAFNCHATSTPVGDASEAKCIQAILASNQRENFKTVDEFRGMTPERISEMADELEASDYMPLITAQKGNLGHCVAGAGALETCFALLSLYH